MTNVIKESDAEHYEQRYIVTREYNSKEKMIAQYLQEMGCVVIGKHDRSMVWWRRECKENGVPEIFYEALNKIYEVARKYYLKKELMAKEG